MDTTNRQTGRTTKQLRAMLEHLRANQDDRALFVTLDERMAVQAREMLNDLAPDAAWYGTRRIVWRSVQQRSASLRGHRFDYVDFDHCADEFASDRAAEMRAELPAFMATRVA